MTSSQDPDSTNSVFLVAETDFGLNLVRQVPVTEQLVISPVSIIFALAMIQLGAKGNTKAQIDQVISKGSIDSNALNYYSNLSSQLLHASHGVNARIANGFFLNKQFNIENQYKNDVTRRFSALIEALDFKEEKEAVEAINIFVNETTIGKIKKLVDAATIKDALSVVVNAIYFNAEWEDKFDRERNTNTEFYSSPGKGRKMTFMNSFGIPRLYTEDEDVQVLSLPYKDDSFAFNIFLPKKRFNLAVVRKKFNGKKIQQLLSQLKTTMVLVTIPKMKIENDFKLKEALMAVGVTEMFSESADLSGIASSPPLRVSEANHKAIIEVDEAGTTAAAATSLVIMPRTAIIQPKDFVADHPFMFVLTKDKNPLFMGQFV